MTSTQSLQVLGPDAISMLGTNAVSDEEHKCVVYVAVNMVNYKMYVGYTTRGLRQRKWDHLTDAKARRYPGSLFYKAIRKHGKESFKWGVIARCNDAIEAKQKEIQLISLIKPEYNLTRGGSGIVGVLMSAETRKKMSLARRGRPSKRKGIPHTDEAKKRMSEAHKRQSLKPWLGKKRSEETKRKISETKRAFPCRASSKPVIYLKNGLVFDSATQAEKELGLYRGAITEFISGRRSPRDSGFIYERDYLTERATQ